MTTVEMYIINHCVQYVSPINLSIQINSIVKKKINNDTKTEHILNKYKCKRQSTQISVRVHENCVVGLSINNR